MPFYRCMPPAGSGGGGGGDAGRINAEEQYIKIDCDIDEFYNYPPLLNLPSPAFNFLTSIPYGTGNNIDGFGRICAANVRKVTIGPRVTGIAEMFWNVQVPTDFTVDCSNAYSCGAFTRLFNNSSFNGNFIFPDKTYMRISYPLWPNNIVGTGYGPGMYHTNVIYDFLFTKQSTFNRPVTIKCHEYSQNSTTVAQLSCQSMFNNAAIFNQQVKFDLYKHYKNETNALFNYILYNVQYMFNGAGRYNQPTVFPRGLRYYDGVFYSSASMNQPVVFYIDTYTTGPTNAFRMSGTINGQNIIFMTPSGMTTYNTGFKVNNFLRVSNAKRINIYANNLDPFRTGYIMSGVSSALTWATTTNGYYNSAYNVYLYNNVTDALNWFNNYYYDFYGEYPVYEPQN